MALTDFYIKQGDTLEPLVVILRDGNDAIITRDLTSAAVRFHMRTASGTLLVANGVGSVINNTTKSVGYAWGGSDTATASLAATPHEAEIQVTYSDGGIETFPNNGNLKVHVFPQVY